MGDLALGHAERALSLLDATVPECFPFVDAVTAQRLAASKKARKCRVGKRSVVHADSHAQREAILLYANVAHWLYDNGELRAGRQCAELALELCNAGRGVPLLKSDC